MTNPIKGVPKLTGHQKELFKAEKILDGSIRVYWAPTQSYDNNISAKSFSIFPPFYSAPTNWPEQNKLLKIPKIIVFHLAFPAVNPRYSTWISIAEQVRDTLEAGYWFIITNVAGSIFVPSGGGSPNLFSMQVLTPRNEDIGNSDWLGTDVLHIVIYQDLGGTHVAGNANGPPSVSAFDFNITEEGTSGNITEEEAGRPRVSLTAPANDRYVYCATLESIFYPGSSQSIRATQLIEDQGRFIDSWPNFSRHSVFIYYDEVAPIFGTEESGIVGYDIQVQTGSEFDEFGTETKTYTKNIYVNNDLAVFDILYGPWNVYQEPHPPIFPDNPVLSHYMKVIWDSSNIWSTQNSFQQTWLSNKCTELANYGWEYKGVLNHNNASNCVNQIVEHINNYFN